MASAAAERPGHSAIQQPGSGPHVAVFDKPPASASARREGRERRAKAKAGGLTGKVAVPNPGSAGTSATRRTGRRLSPPRLIFPSRGSSSSLYAFVYDDAFSAVLTALNNALRHLDELEVMVTIPIAAPDSAHGEILPKHLSDRLERNRGEETRQGWVY